MLVRAALCWGPVFMLGVGRMRVLAPAGGWDMGACWSRVWLDTVPWSCCRSHRPALCAQGSFACIVCMRGWQRRQPTSDLLQTTMPVTTPCQQAGHAVLPGRHNKGLGISQLLLCASPLVLSSWHTVLPMLCTCKGHRPGTWPCVWMSTPIWWCRQGRWRGLHRTGRAKGLRQWHGPST